jgi:hypothetical protein
MAHKDLDRDGRSVISPLEVEGTLVFSCSIDSAIFHKGIYILNKIAENVWTGINHDSSYQKIGGIEMQSDRYFRTITEFYCREGDDCVVVRNVGEVPFTLLQEWVRHTMFGGIRDLLIFEGMYLSKYNRSLDSRIRIIFSSAVDEPRRSEHKSIQQLDVGNILDGCAAAIFCHSEMNSVSAVIYIVVRESTYTMEAARSLESLEKHINSFLGGHQIQFSRDASLHRNMLRGDQFMSTTENMFT